MNIFSKPHVGKHFQLEDTAKKKLVTYLSKIIGQLERIKQDIQTDNACDESLVQILAIKGGLVKVSSDLVSLGILNCIEDYSKEELELILKNVFKT